MTKAVVLAMSLVLGGAAAEGVRAANLVRRATVNPTPSSQQRMAPEGTEPPPAPHAVTAVDEDVRTVDMPAPANPDPLGQRFHDGMVMTGGTPHRLILFTFDDGPHWKTTPKLLDLLDANGVHAVFFLTGDRLTGEGRRQEQQRALAQDIVQRGHIVGNHTLQHLQLPLLTAADIRAQIGDAEKIITETVGTRPWLLRLPGGARSERVDGIAAERGYTSVLWNLGSGDFQVRSGAEVFETWKRVLERREREFGERGGIILMHDTHEWSVEGFSLVYAELMKRNCDLLSKGEELYDIVDDPSLFFVPRADASASAEAPPAVPQADVLEARQAHLRTETAQRCGTMAEL